MPPKQVPLASPSKQKLVTAWRPGGASVSTAAGQAPADAEAMIRPAPAAGGPARAPAEARAATRNPPLDPMPAEPERPGQGEDIDRDLDPDLGIDLEADSSDSDTEDSDADDERVKRAQEMKRRIRRRGEVRVFLSSTFQDMQAERDAFRALVSSKLRGLCAERGLYFHLVDLRWGITGEEATSGEVTRLCLEQVRRSTYFVCILKGRYGWHDTSFSRGAGAEPNKDDALFRRNLEIAEKGGFPNVRRWEDRSVTEIEIREGVLARLEEARGTSFFYLASEEVARSSREADAAAKRGEGPYATDRLEALKGEIRASGLPVEEYADVRWPAAAASEALTEALRGDYALSSHGSRPPHEAWMRVGRRVQAGFAAGFRRVYARSEADEAALDAYAAEGGPEVMLIRGESGCGKTGLLVNWAEAWRRARPEDRVLVHAVGASPEGAQLLSLARRVSAEVQGAGVDGIPGLEAWDITEEKGAGLLREFLEKGAAAWTRRLVLAIDGLDQVGGGPPLALAWLPAAAGPRLRIVATGVDLEAARAGGRPVLEHTPAPLDAARRGRVVDAILQGQGKRLKHEHRQQITGANACGSPLFVTLLIDELAQSSIHDDLDKDIPAMLGSGTAVGLLRRVLRRLASEHGAGVVRRALSALLCARGGAGVEIAELMDFCGALSEEPIVARNSKGAAESPRLLGAADSVDPPTPWALLWANLEMLFVSPHRPRGGYGLVYRLSRACAAEAVRLEYGLGDKAAARAVQDEYDAFLAQKLKQREPYDFGGDFLEDDGPVPESVLRGEAP